MENDANGPLLIRCFINTGIDFFILILLSAHNVSFFIEINAFLLMMSWKTLGGIVKQAANKHKRTACVHLSQMPTQKCSLAIEGLLLLLFFNMETIIPGY